MCIIYTGKEGENIYQAYEEKNHKIENMQIYSYLQNSNSQETQTMGNTNHGENKALRLIVHIVPG